jgi:hypothetical protein
MQRREDFAVSLRKKKKQQILTNKRAKIYKYETSGELDKVRDKSLKFHLNRFKKLKSWSLNFGL